MEAILNDRYQLQEELGLGGMGVVYRAHDLTLDRDVAIKVLTKADLGTEGRARLLHEAQTIAKLNHPNIVMVHDVGEVNLPGLAPYIVMELVEGQNLYEQPMANLDDIVTVAGQICAALEHAHENGIVHRDLKPENIMITPDGTVKLMDFGMARSVASRLTKEGTIMGTVFYLAPEQALGQRIDHRADLYSLGVMLYELTTGELPFQADDPVAVISQHLHAPVIPPRTRNDQVPPALEALILELLRKDPDERPGSAREVLERLQAPEMLESDAPLVAERSLLDRIVRGRMVGRTAELQQARRIWGQAASRAGQLLLISGEPGVGKSRLMREILTQAEISGGQPFIGESQAEGNAPYAPFAQIARRALRAYENDGLEIPNLVMAELIALTPGLQVDYPDIVPNPQLEPESELHRLLDCFYRFITILSEKKPLLLVLEDLHWADSGTLGLLQFLAQRCGQLPVMILGTYREVELDQALPFHETLLNLNRRNLGTRLKLERLDQDQTREMLAILFAEEITDEFLAGIYKETEGNPFFIEEVCKALVESGQMYFDGDQWQRPPDMADMQIPQSIKVAIQSRIRKLSEPEQEILLTAAVIGREFDFRTLQQVTSKEEDTLIEELEAVLRAQLIEELKEGEGESFWFSHALIPAALRESLSSLRRRRMHRQIAQVLEATQPEAYQRLAYHWSEAGDEAKGLEYTIKAADRARKTYANEDAIRLYNEALALLPGDHPDRFDLLASRAVVYDLTAQRENQLSDIEAMLAIAEEGEDFAKQVDALLGMAKLYNEIDLARSQNPAERALEVSRKSGDIKRETRASATIGWILRCMGDGPNARKHLEYAIEQARKTGETPDLVKYMIQLSQILVYLGDLSAGLATAQEAVTLSKKFDDKRLDAISKQQLADAYRSCKEYNTALPIAEAALQTMREIGDVSNYLLNLDILARIELGLGLINDAEAHFLEILQRSEIFSSLILGNALHYLNRLYALTGEYERKLRLVEELLEKACQAVNEFWIFFFKDFYAISHIDLGKYREALEIEQSNWSYIKRSLNQTDQAILLASLGTTAAFASDFELAHKYLQDAWQLSSNLDEGSYKVYMLTFSATVALLDGRKNLLRVALEQVNQAIELRQKYFNRQGWENFFILTGLYMGLLDQDQTHAAKAVSSLEKSIHLFEEERYTNLIPLYLPEHLYFLASRVYRANNRIDEADDYLRQAYERVIMVAGKIQDDDLRQSYLENVPDNPEILKEAKTRGITSETS